MSREMERDIGVDAAHDRRDLLRAGLHRVERDDVDQVGDAVEAGSRTDQGVHLGSRRGKRARDVRTHEPGGAGHQDPLGDHAA